MKNRIFTTLLLSPVLAFTALAQQTTSNSSGQPAASVDQTAPASQPVTATAREPLQAPTPQDFWDGEEPGVAALVSHPFASKQYVKRHVQPIQDRLKELDELTASHRKMIGDVDASARQGLQLASDNNKIADEHALDATNKAQLAQQAAGALDTRVSAVETKVGNIDRYKSGPQTEIRFRPGQTVLSKQAKGVLDEMAAQLKNQHGYIVEVQGFSTGQGQAAIANSRKMADSVVRYLVLNHEIPAHRIYEIGMGNVGAGRTKGARVEISLLKNELEQTSNQ